MQKALPVTVTLIAFAAVGLGIALHLRPQPEKTPGPIRVWVEYAEKYQSEGQEFPDDDQFYAERRLAGLLREAPQPIQLTRNRANADFIVSIAVTRIMNSRVYGTATLRVSASNGDILLSEIFRQDKDSGEDIASQPVSATWRWLGAKTKNSRP